jgi:hypothetical protein
MSTTEDPFERKSSGSGLDSREYGRRHPSHWPRSTLYTQKLALTSPTSGGRSVGIARSRTQPTEFGLVYNLIGFRGKYLRSLCRNGLVVRSLTWWQWSSALFDRYPETRDLSRREIADSNGHAYHVARRHVDTWSGTSNPCTICAIIWLSFRKTIIVSSLTWDVALHLKRQYLQKPS